MSRNSDLSGLGPVRTGLIGLGDFGSTFWVQSQHMSGLNLTALCDQDVEGALQRLQGIGTSPAEIQICDSKQKAQAVMKNGKVPLVPDGCLLAELDLDVLVEASGSPEAGAVHGLAALEAGKHLVMVNKETACTVGPALAREAAHKGVNFGMADGDQPRQILDMVDWAETLGLEVVCAGKAGEADYPVEAEDEGIWALTTEEDRLAEIIGQRSRHIPLRCRAGVADLAELGIVINEKNFGWDRPGLHAPAMHFREMPSVLRPQAEGGILGKTPVVEVANLLSHPHAPSMAGGVFVVVRSPKTDDWRFLTRKRHLMSQDSRYLFLYRPFHLLGIETGLSVLKAARDMPAPGTVRNLPRVDVYCRTEQELPAGHVLEMDHAHHIAGVVAELGVPVPCEPRDPVPYYLAAGRSLIQSVPKGSLLRCRDVAVETYSCLWKLRRTKF